MELKVSDMTPIQSASVKEKKEEIDNGEFSFTLRKLTEEGLQERLGSLINDITVQGKKLADHMDISDMKRYRALIKDFINEVVTHSHEFSRENFLDKRGRHRVYGIIRLINQDVDNLAQELLQKEKNHIRILDLTGEIQGLLLDIMA